MKLPYIIDEIYDAGCFNITDISLLSDSNSIPNVPGESLIVSIVGHFFKKWNSLKSLHKNSDH